MLNSFGKRFMFPFDWTLSQVQHGAGINLAPGDEI
jgi:hypothetical protein